MTSDRWEQINRLYYAALEIDESGRTSFLLEACGTDSELRREVASLLATHAHTDGFLEKPAVEEVVKTLKEEPPSLLGRKLGHYQILGVLGAGGMGVVYQARDTRLNRSVAIKVLPADKVSDAERKRRFVQEAQAASALNHPNIVTVHDIGSEGGIDFIVMEYVAGKTLDQSIQRKGMRLNQALKLAVQMADALAKAHSAGIIHRDLKPTNVMVTDGGLVKLLDFGLAKLTEVESRDGEPLALDSLTGEGMIVGTASYMSPEQAEGKKVDTRSDIFSFGSLLYEMVSGQRAFEGDSKLSTLAAILKQEPKPITRLVPSVPNDLEKIISRCLRKDPSRRFQHMDDLKVMLEELKAESDSGTLAGKPPSVPSSRRAWVWAGAALVVLAIAVTGRLFRGGAGKPQAAPKVVPLTSYPGFEVSPSFSPDGNQVVFSWNGEKQDNFDIYVKLIGSPTPLRLTTNPADDVSPAFSPDGRSIGFVRVSKEHGTFIIIPAIGGPEHIVADNFPTMGDFKERWFAWFPDGKWVATAGLALLSAESGETRSLTSPLRKSSSDRHPAVSPDGRTIAFGRSTGYNVWDIYLLDLSEDLKPKGEPRRLTSLKGWIFGPTWTPNGREIIFTCVDWNRTGGSLWKAPASGAAYPEQLPFNTGEAFMPVISRSGNRLAYQRWSIDTNIWRLSLSGLGVAGAPPARFIASTLWEGTAQYSPDGKRIAFESNRSGVTSIWVSNADGSNAVDLSLGGAISRSPCWSPDGQRVALASEPEGSPDIYVIRASGGKPIRLTTDSAEDNHPSWSRDGKYVYFASERTGRSEVWKVPAGGGEAVQVTRNGGGIAFESPDGKSIFYEDVSGGLSKMPVSGGQESQVLPSVVNRAFSLVNEGIYFIPGPGADGKSSIQFLSFATGKVKTVAPISRPPHGGLSVSPDGRFILFSQVDEVGTDLMLVENFH